MAIIQQWDCPRSAINFLMRDFQLWLINEKLAKRLHSDGSGMLMNGLDGCSTRREIRL
jgi:hypothetical protein